MTQSRLLPTVLIAASTWLLAAGLHFKILELELQDPRICCTRVGCKLGKVLTAPSALRSQGRSESEAQVSLLGSRHTAFITGSAPSASSKQSRTAMRGFKDDFYAWKETLTKDEQSLLLKQAQNEFDKKFRKSDEFTTDLPEDKLQSFGKALCPGVLGSSA